MGNEKRHLSLNINLNAKAASEFDSMSLNLNFEGPDDEGKRADEEREQRLIRILDRFSALSPELQEAVIKYAETLEGESEENNGQAPAR